MKVSASFLSCKNVLEGITKLSFTDVDYIHVDFIDGKFVKGKKIPFRTLKKIGKVSSKRLDVHLMTNKLSKYIKKFALLNAKYITFHVEATQEVEKYIDLVHSYGILCGLSLNPDTDIEAIKPYLSKIDMVLVMSVAPGYGGQAFQESVVSKLKLLRNLVTKDKLKVIISVDGGINQETVSKVKPYVDIVVSGSYITSTSSYQESINTLR